MGSVLLVGLIQRGDASFPVPVGWVFQYGVSPFLMEVVLFGSVPLGRRVVRVLMGGWPVEVV